MVPRRHTAVLGRRRAAVVAILAMDGIAGLKGWQWLFILEGLPACIMGLVTLRILRDKPGEAFWLTPDERTVLTENWLSKAQAGPGRTCWPP